MEEFCVTEHDLNYRTDMGILPQFLQVGQLASIYMHMFYGSDF